MKKIKVISSFLEPFTLFATIIGLGITVYTNNYKYLAIPSISNIPIVILSRLSNKDELKESNEINQYTINYLSRENQRLKDSEATQQLTFERKYFYKIISGRSESRKILLENINDAKEYVILVCPWIANYSLNKDNLKDIIEKALTRGVKLHIAYGHLSDADNNLNLLNEDYLISKKPNMYSGISYFKELNNKYPNQIDISLIGTHEKYLVRDGEFAMIGSHNFLTSSDYSKEREIGLITDDSSIISDLIDNYNKSIETDSFQNDDLDCPF